MNILIEFEDNSLVFDSSKIYLVGRERSCDIQLKNPKVSRTHAKISEINGSWFFEDLDSANGSFINKKQIHNVLIKNNSSIKLGAIDGVELFFKVIESQSDENKTIKIEYDKTKFSNKLCQLRAEKFSNQNFMLNFKEEIDFIWKNHQ